MDKFIPYDKLSKKARRALDQKRRGTWGTVNPAARLEANPKAFKRHPKHKGLDME